MNLWAYPRKHDATKDTCKARHFSRHRAGHAGMCAVHRQIFGYRKLLYVYYCCICDEGLIFAIGRLLGKNDYSETKIIVLNYNLKLGRLTDNFRFHKFCPDQSNMQTDQYMQQDHEDRTLDSLTYASKVGLNKEKKCLDGTRPEILSEVMDWITNTDPAVPHIFWLHEQAGKGKSAIAHTIALHTRNLGLLGSCFCFTHVKLAEGLHTKLFPTITCDLADHDLCLRVPLTDVITKNHSLMHTEDVAE